MFYFNVVEKCISGIHVEKRPGEQLNNMLLANLTAYNYSYFSPRKNRSEFYFHYK